MGDIMRFSNLHTHTVFSDGIGTVRENIESAISKNMLSLGISDHSFTSCDTSYCMKLSDYDKYIEEIEKLKTEYKNKIPIFLGIEKDYFSEIDKDAFDYVISSVHYIIKNDVCYPVDHSAEQQKNCINDAFDGDVFEFSKHFYNMVAEQAALVKPDIIGHFDVINKFSIMPENDEKYINIAKNALKETAKYCNVFEINTGAIARGIRNKPYPNEVLLKLLLEIGGEFVINSDCHNPKFLDCYFKESAELLKNIGYEYFLVFTGNGFDKIML